MRNQILRHSGWVVLLLMFTTLAGYGQVKVGDNPTTLTPGAMLEVQSVNRGFLLPRLSLTTTFGVNAAAMGPSGDTRTAVKGMQVYNTNATITGNLDYPANGEGIYVFDGTGWIYSNLPKGGEAGQVLSKTASGLAWGTPASGVMTYLHRIQGAPVENTGLIVNASGPGVTYSISTRTITINVPAGVRLYSLRSFETKARLELVDTANTLTVIINTDPADGLNTSFFNATLPTVQVVSSGAVPKAFSTKAVRFNTAQNNQLTITITAMDTITEILLLINF